MKRLNRPREDEFVMKIVPTVVIEGKKRKKKIAVLTWLDVDAMQKGQMKLTKRMVLSMVMAQYDPLGLVAPFLIRAKILLRRLYGPVQLDWDDQLPSDETKAWTQFMRDMMKMEPITFRRSARPAGAVGDPWLIGFCDGSLSAFGITIYLMWKFRRCLDGSADGPSSGLADGPPAVKRKVTLLIAKSRVAPVHGTTVPRMELQALTVLSRMMNTVARALPCKAERALFIGDSECVIASLSKTSGSLGPYFTNRIAEIHENLSLLKESVDQVEPVWHVPGQLNPADLGTRGHATPDEVGPGSVWQEGPKFLVDTEREEWPLSRDFGKGSIPQSELRSKHEVNHVNIQPVMMSSSLVEKIEKIMKNCNSWSKSQATLARVVKAVFMGRQAILQHHSPADLVSAGQLLFAASMPATYEALKDKKLSTLMVKMKRGVLVTTGRFTERSLAKLLGKEDLPVLMPTTTLAKLILMFCHEEDHRRNPRDTLARARNHAWIHQGMDLAKKVIKSCVVCRLQETKTARQVMANMLEDILQVSPPFTMTACDLFGPYMIRGMGAGVRKSMKAWGVMFICLRTKATSILACPGYDTTNLETTYVKFSSVYGDPAVLVSDQGTQLVSAAKDMGQKGIDWQRLTAATAVKGTKWVFTPKGCAWRNGMAERAIGMAKKTLSHQLEGQRSLDFHQLDALFHQVARILNSRPIGVRFFSEEQFHAICPNDLLLGRAAGPRKEREAIVPVPQDQDEDPVQALAAHEELCERWWTEWIKSAFPLLVPRRKWATQHRNLAVGDVVLLKFDSKISKCRFRLARVVKVHPDDSGVVRTVTICLRQRHVKEQPLPYRTKKTEFAVTVQRLVVIIPIEEQVNEDEQVDDTDHGNKVDVYDEEFSRTQDEGGQMGDQFVHKAPTLPARRRSQRLQGLSPGTYMVAMAHGEAPPPAVDAVGNLPTALVSLHQGGVPYQIPEWVPSLMDREVEEE